MQPADSPGLREPELTVTSFWLREKAGSLGPGQEFESPTATSRSKTKANLETKAKNVT